MAAGPAIDSDDALLFVAFHAELHRTVRKCVNTSATNIEDACADAWLALLRFKPDRRATVRGWLVVVAIREAVRRDRIDRQLRPLIDAGERDHPAGEVVADFLPALQVSDDDKHIAKLALERVASLDERDRHVFVLHVAGYSYDEIAELAGMTRTAVDRHLRRARCHVRGCTAAPKRGRRSREASSPTAN